MNARLDHCPLENNQSAAIYDGSSWSLQLTLDKKLQSGAISRHETAPNDEEIMWHESFQLRP